MNCRFTGHSSSLSKNRVFCNRCTKDPHHTCYKQHTIILGSGGRNTVVHAALGNFGRFFGECCHGDIEQIETRFFCCVDATTSAACLRLAQWPRHLQWTTIGCFRPKPTKIAVGIAPDLFNARPGGRFISSTRAAVWRAFVNRVVLDLRSTTCAATKASIDESKVIDALDRITSKAVANGYTTAQLEVGVVMKVR